MCQLPTLTNELHCFLSNSMPKEMACYTVPVEFGACLEMNKCVQTVHVFLNQKPVVFYVGVCDRYCWV